MNAYLCRIKPQIAKRLGYVTSYLTFTEKDIIGFSKTGGFVIQVRGANPQYPRNYVDFSQSELIIIS
jgi:hypothetical protein